MIEEGVSTSYFSVSAIRAQFPILRQEVRGKPLVYLDNAATTQKPLVVLDTLRRFYTTSYSNVHRGAYLLSERATQAYESARQEVARFLNASSEREIVFVRGATEGLNLIAHSLGRYLLKPGDVILLSEMEHHSNIVPWQFIRDWTGAEIRVIPLTETGELDMHAFTHLLDERVKIVSVTHVSNSLGTVNPVKEIARRAHEAGAVVVVDGAQAVAHTPVDVQEIDCDFYVFSGHKIYGPTGIGVVYGKQEWLERIPPYQGGGDMIREVTFERTTFNDIPYRFEAGTPNIAGAVGLASALRFFQMADPPRIFDHEERLLQKTIEVLDAFPQVRIIGSPRMRAGAISFVVEGIHAHDIGTGLDLEGICIRTGHHCTQPIMRRFGVPATARVSVAMYNTTEEIERFGYALERVISFFLKK